MIEGLSVIICAYNQDKYIERCLQSVMRQTYTDIEIIVVNDGSTDNTKMIIDDIVKESKDSRIHVVETENSGLSCARNLGLLMARKKYVSFVDADDYLDTTMYEKLIRTMEAKNADVAICYEAAFFDDEIPVKMKTDHTEIKIESREEFTEHFFDLFCGPLTWSWNKVFQRELLRGIRFQERRYLEDIIFTVDYCQRVNRVVWYPERLYFYRQHQNSIMHGINQKRELDHLYAIRYEYEKLMLLIPKEKKDKFIKKLLSGIHQIGKTGVELEDITIIKHSLVLFSSIFEDWKTLTISKLKYCLIQKILQCRLDCLQKKSLQSPE